MSYDKYIYILWSDFCASKLYYVLILPALIDLLYKDYNFDQKFSLSTSSGSGLVRCSHITSFQKLFEFIFLITCAFCIESHSHWCEDQ